MSHFIADCLFVHPMPRQRSQRTPLDSIAGDTPKPRGDTLSKSPGISSDNEDVIPIPIQIFLWRQSK